MGLGFGFGMFGIMFTLMSILVFGIFIVTDTANDRHNKYTEYQDEHQRKHYAEHPETKSQSHVICLSA